MGATASALAAGTMKSLGARKTKPGAEVTFTFSSLSEASPTWRWMLLSPGRGRDGVRPATRRPLTERFDRAREFLLEGSERPEIQEAWRREREAARARGGELGFWDWMPPGTALIVRTFLRGQECEDDGHDVE